MRCYLCQTYWWQRLFGKTVHKGLSRKKWEEIKKITRELHCVEDIPAAKHWIVNMILLHGYSSHSRRLRLLQELFAMNGCYVVVPDLPNHGLSVHDEKDRGFIQSFCDIARIPLALFCTKILWDEERRFSEEYLQRPTFLIGHSMGSLGNLLAFQQNHKMLKKRIAGIVSISTPFQVDHTLTPAMRILLKPFLMTVAEQRAHDEIWNRAALQVPPEHMNSRGHMFGSPEDPLVYEGPLMRRVAIEMERAVQAVWKDIALLADVPLLIVHGRSDRGTPFAAAEKAWKRIQKIPGSQVTFKEVPGGHDVFSLENPGAMSDDQENAIIEIGEWMHMRADEWNKKEVDEWNQKHPDKIKLYLPKLAGRKVVLPWRRKYFEKFI